MVRRWRLAALAVALGTAGCVVYDSGPVGPEFGDRPFVEGRWSIDAFAASSSCGFVDDEPFAARIIQNRDILQLSVTVSGFGELRYDGRLERDGEFFLEQSTIFPEDAIRDISFVEGRFSSSGRSLVATEREEIVDLLSGRSCVVVWRWRGDRR